MKLQSITKQGLLILKIQKIVKGFVGKGRIIPSFKCRHSDMLSYVYSGEAIYYFSDGHTVTVHGGEALYIPKGSSYYYDVLSDLYEYVYVDFVFQFPTDVIGYGESFALKGAESSFRNALDRMNSKWLLKLPGYYEECLGTLYTVYAKLKQLQSAQYTSLKSRKIPEKCAQYIQDNYSKVDFKISELHEFVNCSDVHLRRMFKDYFEMSPAAYLLNTRIENSKILLESTNYSVERIAGMVGFNDPYYFSRVFRKLAGCCPTVYRKITVQADMPDNVLPPQKLHTNEEYEGNLIV